ncbi:MAG: NADP-specific glutamate dehydrogenase [Bacteroidota bacterium]
MLVDVKEVNSTGVKEFMDLVKRHNPNEPEFLQAVEEVAEVIIPFINENKKYQGKKLLERMIEPERVIIFRVPWINDKGEIIINRGFRIEMNSAIGPYKGGLRFHPSVNLSILKFLAFEQVFKNSLTTLPMGGAKGGSDFDPKGKSDNDIMSFSQSFMTELFRHIGPNTDVPAGDIGVGGREIGYLFGQYKRLRNEFTGVLTGKGAGWGGSLIRPQATGYGNVYFVEYMLMTRDQNMEDQIVIISGSGNVAQYAAEKAMQMGAEVITLSDSSGYIKIDGGITEEILKYLMYIKNEKRGRIKEVADKFENIQFFEGKKPWGEKADIAMPCATQNEINKEDAETLVANRVICVAEGANMPSDNDAIKVFQKARILYAPGKASNAGGVAVSGLEMAQNSIRYNWSGVEVDSKLHMIMKDVHKACMKYGGNKDDSTIDYVKGANIAGFVKVADAMLAQGVV